MTRWKGQRVTSDKGWSKAKKVQIDNIWFDSRLEGRRYKVLKQRLQLGVIHDLRTHTKTFLEIEGRPVKIRSDSCPNGRRCSYTDDFRYFDVETGKTVIEDTKGFDSSLARFKRAVFEAMTGEQVRVIKRSGQ